MRKPPAPLAAGGRCEPGRLSAALEILLHPQEPDGPPWKQLPLVLALAFAVRAAVALSGDFVLHPDEIMQYLEPAHRLVFGNGIVYWEYFYGARSWLVPGLVAGVLKLFDVVGLGQPSWYVGGVKLLFCAISLAIPAGMYFFARRHFSEAAARAALLAGAFWYELVGFAHKPMTEFVATAVLMALLALCLRPSPDQARIIWSVALLAVLAAAIRLQYAPLAVLLLGVVFVRTEKKVLLVAAVAVFFLAAGAFDAVTWDAGLFHSWLTNIQFNLVLAQGRAGESPTYQFLGWLTLASLGLSVLCAAMALLRPRRYGLLLALVVVTLLIHSLQAHKEYRFVFAVIPLWLLIGADLVARFAASAPSANWSPGLATAVFVAITLAGILNMLPYQHQVYRAWSRETGIVGFIRNRDPIFAAYRWLARSPGVTAVFQADRPYYQTPGYYYLHHKIPFYDLFVWRELSTDTTTSTVPSVSHIVSSLVDYQPPGYSVAKEFAQVRIWHRDTDEAPLRQWQDYRPVVGDERITRLMRRVDPDAPALPADYGIRFAGEDPPGTPSR